MIDVLCMISSYKLWLIYWYICLCSDKKYPVLGFGAKIRKPDGTMTGCQHCFPIYGGGVEVDVSGGVITNDVSEIGVFVWRWVRNCDCWCDTDDDDVDFGAVEWIWVRDCDFWCDTDDDDNDNDDGDCDDDDSDDSNDNDSDDNHDDDDDDSDDSNDDDDDDSDDDDC